MWNDKTAKEDLGTNSNRIEQLVCFRLGEEELSLPVRSIQEIVRLPEVTPVPGAPESVRGIANLRGNVLSLVDFRVAVGLPPLEEDRDCQVVVVNHRGTSTGMIVDKVSEVLHVDSSKIALPDAVSNISTVEWLKGVARFEGGDRVVMVLDENKIFPAPPSQDLDVRQESTSASAGTEVSSRRSETVCQYVVFRLGKEEYGLPIGTVREVIRPKPLTEIPNTPAYVQGILSLRNEIIPVIDLKERLLSFEEGGGESRELAESNDRNRRIVIVEHDDFVLGLEVDSVSDVIKISEKNIEERTSFASDGATSLLQSVAKLNGGDRLVGLLNLQSVLSAKSWEEIRSEQNKRKTGGNEMENGTSTERSEERHLVCFHLGGENYGIDIMKVKEIVRISSITSVPGAPPFVEGIVNLRGKVLPVIDLRKRFGLTEKAPQDQSRILVVDISGTTTGLIVDGVSEVRRLSSDELSPPPQVLTQGNRAKFITAVGKVSDKNSLLILIEVEALLSSDETTQLQESDSTPLASEAEPSSEVEAKPEEPHDVTQRSSEEEEKKMVDFIVDSIEKGEGDPAAAVSP